MDEFLKKDDPDSLYVSLAIGDSCPYKKSKWREAVDGVLIRARIKPADDHDVGELLLVTTVTCVGISGRSEVVYSIDAEFIKHDVDMDGVWVKVPMNNDDYGVAGIGEKSDALEALEDAVESAITALIEANL
jgi:hypothetical protein